MEFMDGGDLRSFLLSMRAGEENCTWDDYYDTMAIKSHLSELELLEIAVQAAMGLDFLASKKVMRTAGV